MGNSQRFPQHQFKDVRDPPDAPTKGSEDQVWWLQYPGTTSKSPCLSPPVKFSHWHFHWAWTSYLTRLTGRLDPRTPVLPVPLWSNLCCNSSEKVDFQRHLPHPIISLLQIKVSGQCIWLVKTESHACPELQERLGKWVTDFCFRDAGIIRRISFQS